MAVNVLIVDDSGVMRSMIQKTMKLSGLKLGEIHQAANGREGLELLERQWIDLVIADINMPVMTGEEMIEHMQANPNLKTIDTI
ncbi:MAG: response regulator, partial [Desulfobacterales bacterium]|nr:response regulator [Desulfobacterales bacterium]